VTIDGPTLALRLVLACLIGGVLGFDRSREGHAAGLRTYVLVSGGATLFTIVLAYGFHSFAGKPGIQVDPGRAVSQIIVGIGFLGGGSIVARRGAPRGLTTAAGIWFVAAIGLACGVGMYGVAAGAGVVALFVLVPLRAVEERYIMRPRSVVLLRLERRQGQVSAIEQAIAAAGASAHALHIAIAGDTDLVELELQHDARSQIGTLAARLREIDGVREVTVHDM
jgi:putative Mg2+ transporter-C (MgtC) family protein